MPTGFSASPTVFSSTRNGKKTPPVFAKGKEAVEKNRGQIFILDSAVFLLFQPFSMKSYLFSADTLTAGVKTLAIGTLVAFAL